jgi:hypothetical protein
MYIYTHIYIQVTRAIFLHFVNETLNWKPRLKKGKKLAADKPKLPLDPMCRARHWL